MTGISSDHRLDPSLRDLAWKENPGYKSETSIVARERAEKGLPPLELKGGVYVCPEGTSICPNKGISLE